MDFEINKNFNKRCMCFGIEFYWDMPISIQVNFMFWSFVIEF